MTNHKRLIQLMHRAAQQTAPDNLDLWPGIRERLGPLPAHNTRRIPGILTAAAAGLLVVVVVLIFLLARDANDSSLNVASYTQMTPTASPPDETSSPDILCGQYPSYCVPFVGGVAPDHPLANVESPANSRARKMHGGPAGVVRGLTPDGVPFLGKPGAPARFEVALDFGCPRCAPLYLDTLGAFVESHVVKGNAVIQLRVVAVTDSAYAELAAQAALCAGEQGAFWEMTGELFAANLDTTASADDLIPHIRAIADQMGLDSAALETCLVSGRYHDMLDSNRQTMLDRGAGGVPTVWYEDELSGRWLALLLTDNNVLLQLTTTAEKPGGVILGGAVDVSGSDFSAEGVYTDASELGPEKQREYYDVTGANEAFYDGLASSSGWALLTARGSEYVPTLTVVQIVPSGTAPVNSAYRAYDGVILFNWVNNTRLTNPDQYAQISYDVMVDDSKYSLPGDYTLTLRPVGEVIDLSMGAQEITLDYDNPQVVRFQSLSDRPVRLTIDTVSYTTPEQNMPGVLVKEPEIAVLLPYGERLTTFQPGRTPRLEMDFIPPPDDEQFLVLSLLPDTLSETDRRDIVLRVSVAQTAVTPSSEVTGAIAVPPGKVVVSIPDSAFMLTGESLQEGQHVDVIGTVLAVEIDQNFSMPLIIEPDMEAIKTVTQVLVDDALVVHIGLFPVDDSATVDQMDQLIVTLAVSPEEATTLTWALDAKIPLAIAPDGG